MSRRPFGRLPGGAEIEEVAIRAGALSATVLAWGAVVRELRMEGVDHPLALGLNSLEDYVAHSPFFGSIAGRCANRIAGGRFTLGHRDHALELNDGGRHHLHGGFASFGTRPWTLAETGPDFVALTLVSPDGDGGYPGRVSVRCVYRVEPPATLTVELSGETDAPTLLNLAQHCYFDLDGRGNCRDFRLRIAAESRTPTDGFLIPTGAVEPVAGTLWDFRTERRIGAPGAPLYDDNFVLSRARAAAPRFAARATGATGLALEVWTTEPGLQLYDAGSLDCPVPGLDGRRYGRHAGLCLEPQVWPDAINHPGFPSPVLRPGETYLQRSEFRFARM